MNESDSNDHRETHVCNGGVRVLRNKLVSAASSAVLGSRIRIRSKVVVNKLVGEKFTQPVCEQRGGWKKVNDSKGMRSEPPPAPSYIPAGLELEGDDRCRAHAHLWETDGSHGMNILTS